MKKKFVLMLIIFSTFLFFACDKSANAHLAKKLNTEFNKIEKSLLKIEEVSQEDFLSVDLFSFKEAENTFSPKIKPTMKDEEFVFLKDKNNENNNFENENFKNKKNDYFENKSSDNTFNKSNVNTYYENRLPRNVNTYFLPPHIPYGYGMYGGNAYGMYGGNYGGMYGNRYGINSGNYYGANNNFPQQFATNQPYGTQNFNNEFINPQFNSVNRKIRQKNVDTYKFNTSNINSYKNAKNITENKNNSLENTAKLKLNKLSAVYLSASHLTNINYDVCAIKEQLLSTIKTVKDNLKNLEKKENQLTAKQIKSVEILLDNIKSNIEKIQVSKNQLNFELNKIKNIKDSFLSNDNELATRYVLLANFLDTRYSYYSNILNCTQEILYKVAFSFETPSILNNQQTKPDLQDETKIKNNQESVVLKENEINIENVIIEPQTLEKQLEKSWQENFKNKNKESDANQNSIKQNNQENVNQKSINQNNIDINNINQNDNFKHNTQITFENQEEKEDINKNENKNFDLNSNQNFEKQNNTAFKKLPTEKKEVNAENIILDNANMLANFKFKTNIKNTQEVEETQKIKDFFPSTLPFKKPQKNDYLKNSLYKIIF